MCLKYLELGEKVESLWLSGEDQAGSSEGLGNMAGCLLWQLHQYQPCWQVSFVESNMGRGCTRREPF